MTPRRETGQAFCRQILPRVSRTFALSIRILPGTLGHAVRDAYLLCRIADTIEDAPNLSAGEKAALFDLLAESFEDQAIAGSLADRLTSIPGERAHVELARRADLVFESFATLPDSTRNHIRHWVREMISGMRKFVLAYPDGIRIQTVDEYKEYCYYVAGTVGYLLTDLWYEHSSAIDADRHAALRARCRAFAEALQTVNILKDVARDATHENSIYIPEELLRRRGTTHDSLLAGASSERKGTALGVLDVLDVLVDLAWRDLDEATAYLLSLPRRAIAIRLFCALPLLFAYATLRDLTRSAHVSTKISRREVRSLTVLSALSVWSNFAMRALVERTRKAPVMLPARL